MRHYVCFDENGMTFYLCFGESLFTLLDITLDKEKALDLKEEDAFYIRDRLINRIDNMRTWYCLPAEQEERRAG